MPDDTQAPRYRLYSPGQILAASLIGSVLAGAVLYALDQRRLGQTRRAWLTVGLATLTLALLCGLGLALGEDSRSLGPIGYVSGVALWHLAKRDLGPRYQAHLQAGGLRAGHGSVVGIGVVTLVLFLVSVVSLYLVFGKPFGERLEVGRNSVYYTDGVSRDEAQKVADGLVATHVFTPERTADAQLRRADGTLTLVLVHQWQHPTPDQLRELQAFAGRLNAAIAPLHVELAVADESFEITTRVPAR